MKNLEKFKKRYLKNRNFKKRVQWYNLGQRRCHCCGIQMTWENGFSDSPKQTNRTASVEHLVPASQGGTFHMENILITCRGCNNSRGSEDWIEFVERNKFPKSEWLIARYLKAITFYKENKMKISVKNDHLTEYKMAA